MKYYIPEQKHKYCSTIQTNAFVNKACKQKRKYVVIDIWFVDFNKYRADETVSYQFTT